MYGFSWIKEGALAGAPRPGSLGGLEVDLAFLEAQNVRLLVSLTEQSIDPDALARFNISGLHIPVPDFSAPTLEQLQRFLAEVELTLRSNQALCVHCAAGKGRTGTFLAAYLISQGMSAEQAITRIRELRPGSIESVEQISALQAFEAEQKR